MDNNIKIPETEKELTLRKLSLSDWEVIRNEAISFDMMNNKESIKMGTYIKLVCMLGIESTSFYKDKYPNGMVLTDRLRKQREAEYFHSGLSQAETDFIYKKIIEYNNIDESAVDNLKKKSSNI